MRGEAMRRLREETRLEHERLESGVDILSRLGSLQSYVELVQRFHSAYLVLEPALHAALPSDFVVHSPERRHLPSLRADLIALGAPPSRRSPLSAPDFSSPAKAVGAMYVVEGSTLGGQIISRLLQEKLRITPQSGGSFFSGYGSENGAKWRSFCASIETWIATHGNADEVIAGAREAFEWFYRSVVA